jgi:hypothetical protein
MIDAWIAIASIFLLLLVPNKNILYCYRDGLGFYCFLVGNLFLAAGLSVTRNASGRRRTDSLLPEIPCASLKWEYGTEGEFCPELGICATFHSDFWSFLHS